MESDMKNMHITVAMYDNKEVRCSHPQLLDNILQEKIFPAKVCYDVRHNGPHGNPWGSREERGLHALMEDLKEFPDTPQCAAWEGKYIDIWITM